MRYQPLGAVLGIMPWNFPYWQSLRFALPALLTGNSVLIKPAPGTTGSGLALQDCCNAAGLGDVVQTVPAGNDEVAEVIAHPLLRGVSLTGSTRAGRAVAELAGRALKPVVLELGGSDPYLVLADADVEAAATTAATARMQNTGQSCIAAKRFIVVDEVYDAFLARFVEAIEAMPVGDPTDESTQIGPLSSATARETLVDQVSRAVAAGARVASGGHPIPGPGAFFEPTVLTELEVGQSLLAGGGVRAGGTGPAGGRRRRGGRAGERLRLRARSQRLDPRCRPPRETSRTGCRPARCS